MPSITEPIVMTVNNRDDSILSGWIHMLDNMDMKYKLYEILKIFNITQIHTFETLMYNTGAILAGGTITHLLNNHLHSTDIPFPADSDLDIWISVPEMSFNTSVESESKAISLHTERAYYKCIKSVWEGYFKSCGYTALMTPVTGDTEYSNIGFVGHSNICLRTVSFIDTKTERKIQLIFHRAFPKYTIGMFDLNINRVFAYFGKPMDGESRFDVEFNKKAMTDIISKRITINKAGKYTKSRLEKYMKRYDYTSE